MIPMPLDWRAVAVTGLLSYLILVRRLRYRRSQRLQEQYPDQSTLTPDVAQVILADLAEMEFPRLFSFSILFALFKTYGVPSVSTLLYSTGELVSSSDRVSKRMADTGTLILEFCLNLPSSGRATEATARMNYLHSIYQKAGKISNDDMLFTLSLFALEPPRWIKRYEWREFTNLELCACGTFWKAMGDKMDISFEKLPSSKDGWQDGKQWLEEVRMWSVTYQEAHMLPAESNKKIADANIDVLLSNVPKALRGFGRTSVGTIIEPQLRTAIMLPEPGVTFTTAVQGILAIRRLVLRHLTLPRPEIMRKKYISEKPENNGKYSAVEYASDPWYVVPTFRRRWGFQAWMTWLIGRKLPGDGGNRYAPEGYSIKDLGPKWSHGKGMDSVELERLRSIDCGVCPFGGISVTKKADFIH